MTTRSGARRNMHIPLLALACSLGVIVLLASCSSDPAKVIDNTGDIDAYVNSLGTFADPPAGNNGEHVLKDAHNDTSLTPGVGHFICEVSEYRMDKNLHETTVFNANDLSLWPGALVRGGDLDNGLLNPIVVGRAPITVGTDLTGLTAEQGSRTVATPNQLTAGGAINEIVGAYIAGPGNGHVGARLSFDETFVEDFNQSMLDLGISMQWTGWGSGSLQSDFSASTEEFNSSYLCRFSQAYFTASVVPSARPHDVLADGTEVSDLGGYMNASDPPCYVSSVTYGRVGFLSIHSYARKDSVEMAVKGAFSSMGFDVQGSLDAAFTRILNQSEIKILVRGGTASDGVLPIVGDRIQGMYDWIVGGAELTNASDAVPISYTTRYLKDNRLASFAYANEWRTEECSPATSLWQVAVTRLSCPLVNDGWGDYNEETYYTFTVEYQGSAGGAITTETIAYRPEDAYIQITEGGYLDITDAWRNIWLPEQAGARLRLHIVVWDYDTGSGNDQLGDFYTDWYAWPDWRAASACSYPAGYPTPGGDAATCFRHMQDSGGDMIAYWSVKPLVPTQ